MTRHLLRTFLRPLAFVAPLAFAATVSIATPASARPRHPKKQQPAPVMTFDAAPAPTKQAPPPPAGGGTMTFVAPPPVAGPPSKTLERALKFYDQEDYHSATIELNKVLEGQTGDDEGNRQHAEFAMGKSLYKLRFYSESLSYFDRIVQTGPSHRFYRKTLEWLASLSQYLPESAGVLGSIGKYNRADLEEPALEPVRDELYYLLGRYHYTKAEWKDALDLLQALPEQSEYYAPAKFLEGMTYVRQQQSGQSNEAAKPAAEAFKAILRKAIETPDKKTMEFVELANLSLARTFYSLGQYKLAVKYYDKIEQESSSWLPSLFESSWAQFQLDDDSRALGNIHTLNAPYFEYDSYPESVVLKSVIYFQRCNYDRAMEAVNEFNQVYPGLQKDINAVVASYPDNGEFYTYVLKIRDGETDLPERVQRAAQGALADRTLSKSLDYVAELDRELKQIDQSDPAWRSTAIAGTILQDITLQRSLAANDAGQLARERLKRLAAEIRELTRQATKVEFETLGAQKGAIEASIQQEQQQADGANKTGFGDVKIDDEHEKWPFTGEYWKDELGYYRFKVANLCRK